MAQCARVNTRQKNLNHEKKKQAFNTSIKATGDSPCYFVEVVPPPYF